MTLYEHVDAVILRDPAQQRGAMICPECGQDIDNTKGTGDARVPVGSLVDADLAAALDVATLPVHGWACTRHDYTVVCPAYTTRDAGNVGAGWTGILVEFATGHARRVPIPEREVRP
jgi:hypothetical protein